MIMKEHTLEDIIDKYILNRFFKYTIYIQFKSDWIRLTHVESGRILEDKPCMMIEENKKGHSRVIAVGKKAEKMVAENRKNHFLVNGFEHPRSCVGDFELCEALLRSLIRELIDRYVLIRPIIVMHPLEKIEGGITGVEKRGIAELAESVGARKAYVWVGHTLTNRELHTLSFLERLKRQSVLK